MCAKPGFMLYCDWEETLLTLPPDSLQELLRAAFLYTRTGALSDFCHHDAALVWTMLRPRLDYDTARYEAVSQRRRAAAGKRWDKPAEQSAPAPKPASKPAPKPAPKAAPSPAPVPPGGFPPIGRVNLNTPMDYSPAIMNRYLE